MTTIKLKNGSGAPAGGDLVQGEPALDLTNKRLYTENASGTVIEVGTNPGVDVTFADNRKAIFGAGSDLQIYHDGSNSYVGENGTGDLRLTGNSITMLKADATETYAQFLVNGAVNLYYDNSAKLATSSTGIDVTGSISADSAVIDNITIDGTEIDSSSSLSLDIAGNLTIDVDGSTVTFADGGVNFGQFYQNAAGQFNINSPTQDKDIVFLGNDGGSSIEAMRIDMSAGGNVGIGTSSPDTLVHAYKASNAILKVAEANGYASLQQSGVNSYLNSVSSGGSLIFRNGTAPTERMRIDSSGNLLVGQSTSTAPASDDTVGVAISPLGYISTHRTGVSAEFGRNNTDGDIAVFRKDGSTVGSIGSEGGNSLYIGNDDANLRFSGGSNAIVPAGVAGASSNGLLDLGLGGLRFKDLYLSGGAYLGGTGSANKLDDYEEGTWTPVFTASTTTISVNSATYTKIGRRVNLQLYIGNISPATSSDQQTITGLPFSVAGSDDYPSGSISYSVDADVAGLGVLAVTGGSYIYFHYIDGTKSGSATRNDFNSIKSSGLQLIISLSYNAA